MALYTIGDLHLSFATDKPMDIFGVCWHNHPLKIKENWCLSQEDTCVIAGDSSWAINLEEATADLRFINDLPGHKIILKGNHDYWWETLTKLNKFKKEKNLNKIDFLFNNSFCADGVYICGTRGWIRESGVTEDETIIAREAGRLRLSLESCRKANPLAEPVVFLHYPPLFANERCAPIMNVLKEYNIKKLYYGHLHGKNAHALAVEGIHEGIDMKLISCDYTNFTPVKIS